MKLKWELNDRKNRKKAKKYKKEDQSTDSHQRPKSRSPPATLRNAARYVAQVGRVIPAGGVVGTGVSDDFG